MKFVKSFAVGSLALGFVGSAMAATTDVYLCGSTAFRSAVVNAEIALLGGSSAVATAENDTKAVGSTTISNVLGTDPSGNVICFHNHWTGSVAGVTDITNSNALSYIDDSLMGAAGSNVTSAAANDSVVPQASMSDNVFTDAATTLANSNTAGKNFGKNITGLIDGGSQGEAAVAVVTFEWLLGNNGTAGNPSNWTSLNITQDQASYLLTNGSIPLSVVTGNPADASNFLLFVGRNEDSGSRALYQGESWGAGLTPKVISGSTVQWMVEQSSTPGGTGIGYPTSSTGTGYPAIAITGGITAIKKWPAGWTLNTETAVTWSIGGHSGYNGGGDVAAILGSPSPVTGLTFTNSGDASSLGSGYNPATSQIYLVTLIGTHDAASATGSTVLKYNGVSISDAALTTGQYALWNYEHLYYTGSLSGLPKTAADELADEIYDFSESQLGGSPATAGGPGLPVSSMLVLRATNAGGQIK